MAETAVVTRSRELTPFEATIDKARRSIVTLSGSKDAADALAVIILNQARKNPNLFKCTEDSIIDAVVRIARLKLDPSIPNEVWLIPYNTKYTYANDKGRDVEGYRYEATLQYGYGGLRKLVLRSPDVRDVFALAVCENDHYEPALSQIELPTHRLPGGFQPRGRTIGYYAAALLTSGVWRVVSMSKAEVAAHRDRYSQGAKTTFWSDNKPDLEGLTNFDKMAMKTCLRMLCTPRMLSLTAEVQSALQAEQALLQVTPTQLVTASRGSLEPQTPETRQTIIEDLGGERAAVEGAQQAARAAKSKKVVHSEAQQSSTQPEGNQGPQTPEASWDPVASAALDRELANIDPETGEILREDEDL